MAQIEEFCYSLLSDQKDKSIFEILPKIVFWTYDGKRKMVENDKKIIARLLLGDDLIAIIEAPFSFDDNKAYIIDGNNNVYMDISLLLKKKYSQLFNEQKVAFFEINLIEEKLFFFINAVNRDFRIEINLKNKTIGNLIESR